MNHKLNIEIEITQDFLRDVLITACEGGIGYWSRLSKYKWRKPDAPANATVDEATLDWPVAVVVEEGRIGVTVTPELVRLGIERALAKGCGQRATLLEAVATDDAGLIDSELGDVIIQYALLFARSSSHER